MENLNRQDGLKPLSTEVFEISGEPAIVINGLPPMSSCISTAVPCAIVSDIEPHRNTGFGEWLEGRDVQKLFGEQFYNGRVTDFDKETGWYRVVYEDGDFEDLDWPELQEVLVPLDITVPLKTLALKVIRKRQKRSQEYGKTKSKTGTCRVKYAQCKWSC